MAKPLKFHIQGLDYETPPVPKKQEIYLHDLPKKEQYWRRRDLPSNISDAEMQKEWNYILNGFWFYNFGEPTYLTGANYFYLQYFILEHGEYADYRSTDSEYFYFWNCLERNRRALGCILLKFRRQGMSSKAMCISLYICLTEENAKCGTVSMTGEEAEMLFKEHLVNGFVNLPDWIKPRTSGTDRSVKELVFQKPSERLTKNKTIATNESMGLNNKASWKSTKENSYDGGRNRYLVADEAAKWDKIDVSMFWSKVAKTLLRGASRVGMVNMLSTCNDFNSGAAGFKEIWDLSDHTKTKDGITASRLYRYFMPAWYGYPGYFNKYGHPIIENPTPEEVEWLKSRGEVDFPEIGSKEFLDRARKELADKPDLLSEEKRQNPYTIAEAFYKPASACIVNPLVANQQIEANNERTIPFRRVKFYRDFADGKIKIMDTPDGCWKMLWDFEDPNTQSNRTKIVYGKKHPLNKELFGIGVDPYASSEGAAYSKASKGIAYVKRFFNPLDPDTSDLAIAEMDYRPRLKSMFFEQIFYASEYFGCLTCFEQTVSDFFDYATEHGYENFLVYTPVELRGESARIIKAGCPATSKKSIEFHCNMIVKDFNENSHKYYFNDLLVDIIDFDAQNRTEFDRTMAWGYTLICEHVCTVRQIVVEKTDRKALVKRYSIY